jgi:hypothetical protein
MKKCTCSKIPHVTALLKNKHKKYDNYACKNKKLSLNHASQYKGTKKKFLKSRLYTETKVGTLNGQ